MAIAAFTPKYYTKGEQCTYGGSTWESRLAGKRTAAPKSNTYWKLVPTTQPTTVPTTLSSADLKQLADLISPLLLQTDMGKFVVSVQNALAQPAKAGAAPIDPSQLTDIGPTGFLAYLNASIPFLPGYDPNVDQVVLRRGGVTQMVSLASLGAATTGGGGGATTTFTTAIIPDSGVNVDSATAGHYASPKNGVTFTAQDSATATHVWSYTGPGGFIQNGDTTSPTFSLGNTTANGVYNITLVSTPTTGTAQTKNYALTVSGYTQTLTANAGPDAQTTADSYPLQGSASPSDPGNYIYKWEKVSEPAGNVAAGRTDGALFQGKGLVAQGSLAEGIPTITAIVLVVSGPYVFKLTVTNPTTSATDSKTVTITKA